MNRLPTLAALAALSFLALAPRAAAETGRFDGLKTLIDALPEKNPGEDPAYMDTFGDNIPAQMAGCHWKADEMEAIERILALFDKHKTDDGVNKKALIEDLGKLPDFAGRDKDKKARSDYNDLKLGITLAPDMTKASLVNADCRAMIKQHYDNGATKALLMGVLVKNKFALDAALPPR